MKRIYFSLLVFVLLSFVACNGKKSEPDSGKPDSNNSENTTTDPDNGGTTDPQNGGSQGGTVLASVNNNFKALPFSVAYGKTVVFSQGNLQYNAANDAWRFAGKQWEFVGDKTEGNVYEDNVKSNNRSIDSDYNGWIDLFGWGTSGWNSGAKEYMPYACSSSDDDYYLGGSSYNSMTGSYAEADWGVHNAILNGGNAKGIWRTLTRDEWKYLLHDRNLAHGLVSTATVNGVRGIVVLPDSWAGAPSGLTLFTFVDIEGIVWNDGTLAYEAKNKVHDINVFTENEWALLEAEGAVFLPCAGRRKYTTIDLPNSMGCYWSSTADIEDEGYSGLISCQSSGVYTYSINSRSYGYSVRLVK